MGKKSLRRTSSPPSISPFGRIKTILHDEAPVAEQPGKWDALETNPWMDAVKSPRANGNGHAAEDLHLLEGFPAEGLGSEGASAPGGATPKNQELATETPSDEDVVVTARAEDPGEHTSPRPAVTALLDTVSEASNEVRVQLTAAVQEMKKAAAEQHSAEIKALEQRHTEELQKVRATVEAEVAERVRREEAERWTAEAGRLREQLEKRYADELRGAQTAVVDSVRGLTGHVLQQLQ